ncbi:DUF6259 domain-containing protein [Ereboglobus luteus]|uniref:DUF6259 domain-containing protein n=1 Tax=Ereboglobus luteus TaxID=1796921 RepID=UPI00192D2A7C|nr:DUF6259 domain-containing protein [Ereboglobus luteus]
MQSIRCKMPALPKLMRAFAAFALLAAMAGTAAASQLYTLVNDKLQVSITDKGELASLKNLETGQNYAGSGHLWRLYYDTPKYKELQVTADSQAPKVSRKDGIITISYDKLTLDGRALDMQVRFDISLEDDFVRFSSEVKNNEPHTVIRELHYPLVANMPLPKDHKLLITDTGGQVFNDVRKEIMKRGNTAAPYRSPAQYFRQWDVRYPARFVTTCASNCFAFFSDSQGLYFGSHDPSFQDTWHGLRLYPDKAGNFTQLEAGFYKYPQCVNGQTWKCDANVIGPYSGTWHQTSKLYRRWADTWWEHRDPPAWVKRMKSWQRIILRHQYGEQFFKYTDLPGRIKNVGESVGADTVFAFGWWETGMDNGNPHYDADPAQGGDAGWKKAIADYKKNGGRLLLYFNGKLIDRESEFYKNGPGKEICYKDNTGAELTEQYRFTGMATFLGSYNARTFVVADTRDPRWQKMLLEWAARAYDYGADSVFYDQLGYVERTTNWDISGEFPIPNHRVLADKAAVLKKIRAQNMKKSPEFALGTEWLTDATAQYCDYIHIYTTTAGPNSFIDWFRYTFPEVIVSDREIRDDTDIERRVNNTVLKGLVNDIEIYRCRDLIDKTPTYQAYLAKINEIKQRYIDLIVAGTYRDTEGFTNSNPQVEARAYTNGNGMAVVVTQTVEAPQTTAITVPGYKYKESRTANGATVSKDGGKVSLGQHALAVLVYEKTM